ncbi:MAG: UDP-3-O-acyl-N-acetylglucosamine deacetylase, partial [Desulfomonilaceae bacterium]
SGSEEVTGATARSEIAHRDQRPQKTLRGKVVIYGQGLHSGQKTGLTISPLPASSGINFGHITSGGTVPALLTFVESTDFCTSLRGNESLARTIEHLMAVFHVYGLTNLLVKISGEVPIMDGSALEFCNLVENAEIITQDEIVEEIVIQEPIELPMDAKSPKSMRVEPSDVLEVEYHMDYPRPIGKMDMAFRLSSTSDFKSQIAPARTFGFVRDMKIMDEMGLAGGGKLSNLVLLDEDKVVNPPLRFENEFVRHKILDIIGDFYLLGRPIIGKIIAKQTGHSDNIAMLRIINDKFGLL